VTIVAAAGHHADYGLHGVSTRTRQEQGHGMVQGVKLLQIFPHTGELIRKSTWASRGWTFQEGYLSTRRLIFTDQQVSLVCNGMYAAESVEQPPLTLNHFGLAPFHNMVPSQDPHKYFVKLISEYTTRSLRYDSDSLLAILGMFRSLEPAGIYHIWGVPLAKYSGRLAFSLDWFHETAAIRRPGFPSWSWCGWHGKAEIFWGGFNDDFQNEVLPAHDSTLNAEPYNLDFRGKLMNAAQQYQYMAPNMALKYIHVKGNVIDLSFKFIKWTPLQKSSQTHVSSIHYRGEHMIKRADGFHAILKISNDLIGLAYVYMDDNCTPHDGLVGLVLERKMEWNVTFWKSYYHSILILKKEQHFHERIGVIRVRSFDVETELRDTAAPCPPMGFMDNAGNILDKVDMDWKNGYTHLWFKEGHATTIKMG